MSDLSARQLAFMALKAIHKGAFADVALDRVLSHHRLTDADRRLLTELVYGCIRRMRSLDCLIDQLAQKPARNQPPDVRTALHLGLYQLRYLQHIPASAAVHTTVELFKQNRLSGLTGFANGLLRQYLRLQEKQDPLTLPTDPLERLGVFESYPDWMLRVWAESIGVDDTAALCQTLNQSPAIDLRINPLKIDRQTVQAALTDQGVATVPFPDLPQALRIVGNPGPIRDLAGYAQGWWTVQDASAQLVGHWVNPHPGATVIDLCAAPGGKTTHLVELMQGQGTVWACDRTASRLRRLQQNLDRLGIDCVQLWQGDSRQLPPEMPLADYVLLDAPCSGLGTLHRHADARWRIVPDNVQELSVLQSELLTAAARQVKPNGAVIYATCTLHPQENETVIQNFLAANPRWQLASTTDPAIAAAFQSEMDWVKIWPHQRDMDGFFMARLHQSADAVLN